MTKSPLDLAWERYTAAYSAHQTATGDDFAPTLEALARATTALQLQQSVRVAEPRRGRN